uniref:Uncharacterized protein n=1 Tax=Romanomermis culicivorax TaxID=13658 RepID=A0A915JRD1_ROMCU
MRVKFKLSLGAIATLESLMAGAEAVPGLVNVGREYEKRQSKGLTFYDKVIIWNYVISSKTFDGKIQNKSGKPVLLL